MFDQTESTIIIQETTDFLIAAKPPGMETISQDGGAEFTALLQQQRKEQGLVPVHRLDRDTSGAQLFARNPAAEKELTALFRHRQVDKTYLALTLGIPRNREGRIQRNLSEWSGGRKPVRILKKGGLEAVTAYRILHGSAFMPQLQFKIGVIAFSPHQGRTHQIRVHAAGLGYPILGDDQYGDRPANRLAKDILKLERQALHAWGLAFPWRGAKVSVTCPLPQDLQATVLAIGGKAVATMTPVFFS